MTHEPRTPISKVVEPSQDEVEGHKMFFGISEVTDEVEGAEVEGHRWSYVALEMDDNSEMVTA